MNHLNSETFATATFCGNIGIIEFEALIETFLNEVKFSAIKISQAFRIDKHLNPGIFKNVIFRGSFINKLQYVSHS